MPIQGVIQEVVRLINDLIIRMSCDMGISRYQGESDDSFIYRVCYSMLGQWCLYTAKNSTGDIIGTTKHNQTGVLNDLLSRITELFSCIADKFIDTSNQEACFSINIRRLFEETGYLITDNNNHNRIANFGRSIKLGKQVLFFGLPNIPFKINGLGIYSVETDYLVDIKDFLIRDSLTNNEYFNACFDPIDFYKRDIEITELEFFNPKSKNAPSKAWNKTLETECTIARRAKSGPFYRIMKVANEILFADEFVEQQNDSLTSYEFRRICFSLKAYYGNPLKATITKLDDQYSKICLGGYLPNREYYLLLLMSWPEKNAFDKVNFIIHNDLLTDLLAALEHIGIEIKIGKMNE